MSHMMQPLTGRRHSMQPVTLRTGATALMALAAVSGLIRRWVVWRTDLTLIYKGHVAQ